MNKHLYSAVLAQRKNPFIAQGRCGTLSLSFNYRSVLVFSLCQLGWQSLFNYAKYLLNLGYI